MLRADNRGEGGIMALLALALGAIGGRGRLHYSLLLIGVFGRHCSRAYGIAVTATMLATTILTYFVIRYRWRMNLLLCLGTTAGSRCCSAPCCSR